MLAVGLAVVLLVASMAPHAIVGSDAQPADRIVPEPPLISNSPPPDPPDAGAATALTIPRGMVNAPKFSGSSEVRALTPAAVARLEADGEAQDLEVIENEDGLVVLEMQDGGRPVRIAALNEKTTAGTSVIGIAFLDEEEIHQLEEMQSRHATLFRPHAAQAHYQGQSHYHYFYNCSYVYNQGGTYGISWYMCPNDTTWDRLLGYAIAGALGVPIGPGAWLRWIGGMLIGGSQYYFYESDGSLRGSLSDFRAQCGWLLWTSSPGPNSHWMYYYCAGSTNFGKGWDDFYDKMFYVRYP